MAQDDSAVFPVTFLSTRYPDEQPGLSSRAMASHPRYDVEVGGRSCQVPCSLELPAGRTRVNVTGNGAKFNKDVEIPAGPSVVKVNHLSVFGIVFGASLIGVGLPASIAALSVILNGTFFQYRDSVLEVVVWTSLSLGVLFTAMGSWILANMGSNRAVITQERDGGRRSRLRWTPLGLIPVKGGAVVGLGFLF